MTRTADGRLASFDPDHNDPTKEHHDKRKKCGRDTGGLSCVSVRPTDDDPLERCRQ